MEDPATEGIPEPVFGRVLTAMVTPFDGSLGLDVDGARRIAAHLVDEQGNDGLVINGTTGESPTTSDEEKLAVLRAVIDEVGDRASVVAGVGTNDTRHTCELARRSVDAGADGLLVVTPYYSRPPVAALEDHFTTVADATELPVMLYDIPHRAGIPIPEASLIRLADHPRIAAVKDAKGEIVSSSAVLAATTLQYYAGDDAYLLPLLSVGGVGVVGTSTHVTGRDAKAIVEAYLAGRIDEAIALHRASLPSFRGIFATQGCMMVKAVLAAQGLDVGACRPPMGAVPDDVVQTYLQVLAARAEA